MSTKKETTAVEPAAPVFDPFGFTNLFHWPARFGRTWPDFVRDDSTRINVEEFVEDDELHIRAEIPGVDPDEDIEITVDSGRLTIRAERENRTESTEDGYRSEFRYGSFSRVLPLPEGAKFEDVHATYKDGILDVRVPIDDERVPARKIPVSS